METSRFRGRLEKGKRFCSHGRGVGQGTLRRACVHAHADRQSSGAAPFAPVVETGLDTGLDDGNGLPARCWQMMVDGRTRRSFTPMACAEHGGSDRAAKLCQQTSAPVRRRRRNISRRHRQSEGLHGEERRDRPRSADPILAVGPLQRAPAEISVAPQRFRNRHTTTAILAVRSGGRHGGCHVGDGPWGESDHEANRVPLGGVRNRVGDGAVPVASAATIDPFTVCAYADHGRARGQMTLTSTGARVGVSAGAGLAMRRAMRWPRGRHHPGVSAPRSVARRRLTAATRVVCHHVRYDVPRHGVHGTVDRVNEGGTW